MYFNDVYLGQVKMNFKDQRRCDWSGNEVLSMCLNHTINGDTCSIHTVDPCAIVIDNEPKLCLFFKPS